MTKRLFLISVLALFLPFMSSAQFFVTGDNPGKLKWYSIDTDNYSIIYPKGTDSLAKAYGYYLEQFRVPVSRSVGYLPGGPGKKRMPVVINAYNTANGSVAWAPKRMDLFTIPSSYNPEPLPWDKMLSVHESRHVAQMQLGLNNAQKPFGWFLGEMWNGLSAQLYLGISNLEGDAVIAETALTNSGRGRTADFLNYYRVAFDNGDFRKWDKWRFMSQHNYSPDHYALGYLTLAGFRYLYDCPEYVNEACKLAARNPLRLDTVYDTAKKLTGKNFDDAFLEVCDTLHRIWKAEADARAPFICMEPVTAEPRLYTDYEKLVFVKDSLYAVKSGHLTAPVLVRIGSDNKESRISSFSSNTSSLKASPATGRLYWTETTSDARWSMKTSSRLRYSELNNASKKYLTKNDMSVLFNPGIGTENHMIASVSFDYQDKARICIVDEVTGKEVSTIPVPEWIQPVETAWIGNDLYISAITDLGYGIWEWKNDEWKAVLCAEPVMISNLDSNGNELTFTSDRTGVNEFYHFNPETKDLVQKTVTRYGGSDFTYSPDGEWLYYTSQTMNGKKIFRTPVDSLINRKADFSDKHTWVLAEKLAQQEKDLAAAQGYYAAVTDVKPTISEPKRYRKFPHAFNIHSWAPFYVSVDNLMNMSFDYTWEAISLGATGIMQNRLSTFVGEFGYSAHKDPYQVGKWRNSGHVKFTYSGWYPVFEVSADFNDRSATQTSLAMLTKNGQPIEVQPQIYLRNTPYMKGNVSVYVPWSFSRGGWFSGIIPKVSYTISNDMFDNEIVRYEYILNSSVDENGNNINVLEPTEVGRIPGNNKFQQTIQSSLRGFAMTGVTSSAVYPRWGIGAEIGHLTSLDNMKFFSPMGYFYTYGYIPGFIRSHGIKMTYTHQTKWDKKKWYSRPVVDFLPRGFGSDSNILNRITAYNPNISKFSVDYAAPIYIGDVALGGTLFSIKRLILTPHFDYTYIRHRGNLFSAGAELILDLHSILWLEFPCSFGITASYNGGSLFNESTANTNVGRYFVGPTFNVSF